jgi:radical SAM protein (TIGR01212 family)
LRQRFGVRVQRVSVNAGFTCPNVDGTVATGGCVFCNNRSFSPSRRLPRLAILAQIDEGIRRLKQRYECEHFMAYFQPATNTYAPVERLRELYEEALSHPQVIALAIGTRPDCVPDDVVELLAELGQRTYLALELGMQSMHDRSLDWMNRGHDHAAFVDAIHRCRSRGFEVGAHMILGIPGESREDMLATAEELAKLKVDAVKIHNLYAVRNTSLGDQVARGEVPLMERDEYVDTLIEVLERLPPTTIVERICGEAPPQFLVGPAWCRNKADMRMHFVNELELRDTWQGKLWNSGRHSPR